jgi:hypothetical protein
MVQNLGDCESADARRRHVGSSGSAQIVDCEIRQAARLAQPAVGFVQVPKMPSGARREDEVFGRVVRLGVETGDDLIGMWLDFGKLLTRDLVEPNSMLYLILDPARRDHPPAVGTYFLMPGAEHFDRSLRSGKHHSIGGSDERRPGVKSCPKGADLVAA